METRIVTLKWQRLDLLAARFKANCAALAQRDPALSLSLRHHVPEKQYVIASEGDELHIGVQTDAADVERLGYRLTPMAARAIADNLCPDHLYSEPALIAGLDQGWLWQMVYEAQPKVPARPGYRPPLYLLARTLDQLWIACHLHDYRDLLADPRVFLFAGDDAVDQLETALRNNSRLTAPQASVTLDPALWPAGCNLDLLKGRVNTYQHGRLATAMASFDTQDRPSRLSASGALVNQSVCGLAGKDQRAAFAARLRAGGKIRVMGLTSRFTTFLQHSMRDWLAAFEAEGHATSLVIETADHEQNNRLILAEAAAEFAPDLILLIDHYRAELGGLPAYVPCVMWIQDYMPNIFTPSAGDEQGPLDFVIGHGRAECTRKHNYPSERFMPALVAVNDERFAPPELSEEDRRGYACDLSFVSHASRPAESIIAEQIERHPNAKRLLTDAFERLKSIYDDGLCISHPLHVRGVIQEAMIATGLSLDADSLKRMSDLFHLQINNAFLRHQALEWAAETGADLRLYGNGWEKHPRLSKFARGPADHQGDLRKIYRATRISLQATPQGSVHQRTFEGLAAGGFFLMRYVPGDRIGQIYKPLWEWCSRENIETDDHLLQHATPDILRLLGEFQRTAGLDPFKLGVSFIEDMRMLADLDFTQSACMMWPGDYERVAFDSRAALQQRITHFLENPAERESIAESMRQVVLERVTYRAVDQRMLQFIAQSLEAAPAPLPRAA